MNDNGIPEPNELPVVEQDELNDILERHAMFLRGKNGGQRAQLQYKDLSDLNFHNRDLSQADFTGSMLVRSDLSFGIYKAACFFACDLRDADLSNANLSRADLRGSYFTGANLSGANLTDTDMRAGKIMQKSNKYDLVDRERSGGEGANTILTGARLKNADLSGSRAPNADFTDADLSEASTRDADFHSAIFKGANLSGTDFTGSVLTYVDMTEAILSGALLDDVEDLGLDTTGSITEKNIGKTIDDTGQTLEKLLTDHGDWIETIGKKGKQLVLSDFDLRDLSDLRFQPLTAIYAVGASFVNQDLSGASIQGAVLDDSDFRDCYMENIDLRGSSLRNAKMKRANLRGAQLSPLQFDNKDGSKRLNRVNLSGSDLKFSNLQDADLRDAILIGVNLTYADLSGADLRRADLSGAIIEGAKFDNALLDGTIIDLKGV